jgi:alpha-L-fucosidase 2
METALRYDRPAREWNEALPIGNGVLGAMVSGGVGLERWQLNEDSLWYGGPRERTNPDARSQLGELRRLIFAGKIAEAERLAMLAFAGVPEHPSHYVPLGDLILDFEPDARGDGVYGSARRGDAGTEGYLRKLDLAEALHSVVYRRDGVEYLRECFASAPDRAIVARVSADRPGAINFSLSFGRGRYAGSLSHPDARTLRMTGSGGGEGGVAFSAMARVLAVGGAVAALGETILVEGADEAVVVLAAATSYRPGDPDERCLAALGAAMSLGYGRLRERHVDDYRSLFGRMSLRLGPETAGDDEAGPPPATDARLAKLRSAGGERDEASLAQLYFDFGRYLLISSSRPGSLPANLQGLWNEDFLPPWGSKYTININAEMNYWPAEACGLGDCHLPLFDLTERMLPNGKRVAREMYGCGGFVAHHNTDLWGDCDPVDRWVPATLWPMGAAWLSLHIWQHFEYSGSLAFLNRYYPVMREAALFILDFLVPGPGGRLVTCPSVSPENTYVLHGGERGCVCYGAAMDNQIIRALFKACAAAERALDSDPGAKALGPGFLGERLAATAALLPEDRIGATGGLMEWAEDYEEAEPGHRHISQLFALYPDDAISLRGSPELARAARTTLDRRLERGGGHTGWSKAWIINLRARLGQGDEAWAELLGLLRDSTLPNLLDTHPPFQIDGNFGGASGILEMLLQCVGGEILVLPALPRALSEGEVRGARAKGGFELDFQWKIGRLTRLRVRSGLGGTCRLRVGGGAPIAFETRAGEACEPIAALG